VKLSDERREDGAEFVTERESIGAELFFPLPLGYAFASETGLASLVLMRSNLACFFF